MELAAIIVGSIIFYSTMMGFTYKLSDKWTAMIEDGCAFFALFWPVALPAMTAWKIADSDFSFTHTPRVEKRRAKEIEEAQHRKRLAEIAAEELAINERSLNIK